MECALLLCHWLIFLRLLLRIKLMLVMINEFLRMNVVRKLVFKNFIRSLNHDFGQRLLVRALTLSHLNEAAIDDGGARVLNLPFDTRVIVGGCCGTHKAVVLFALPI